MMRAKLIVMSSLVLTAISPALAQEPSPNLDMQLQQVQQLQQAAQQPPNNSAINNSQYSNVNTNNNNFSLPNNGMAAPQMNGGNGQIVVTQNPPDMNSNNSNTSGMMTAAVAAPSPAYVASPQGQPQQQAPGAQQAQVSPPVQQMVMGDPNDIARQLAYKNVTQNLMPLTPEQIQNLHEQYNASQAAAQSEGGTPPRPVASSKVVSLAPGATPPVIRLSQGFVSSLVFVDSTGAPWPIKSYDLGNPGAFNIQWDKKSNTLMVQATKLYTYGNLAVLLEGLTTPVMITLVPGQRAIDYRADLRIQGRGPNAHVAAIGDGLPSTANPILLGVLDGVPPPGSKSYNVLGGLAQAWIREDKLYLRTRLTVLSPGWIATMTSADGTKAYEMQRTPMLLVSDNGKLNQLKIEGL